MEEKSEAVNEEHCEEEQEEIETADELVKEKSDNKFNACENTAQI